MARQIPQKSFAALQQQFLQHLLHERALSAQTIVAYNRDLDDFVRFISGYTETTITNKSFALLELHQFRAWLSARHARGLSASSTARAISSLRSLNNYCRLQGFAINHHLGALRAPKKAAILPRPLSESESFRLLEAAANNTTPWIGKRDVAICCLLWGCGLRIAEALQIIPQDLQRPDRCLRILGKGNKQRLVPLLPLVQSAIAEYQHLCPHSLDAQEALFRGVRGKALNPRSVQMLIMRLRRELGLPEKVTPHALRHSFASDLLRGGGDLRTIQELLGHASLNSTQRYADIDRTALAQIYQRTHQKASR